MSDLMREQFEKKHKAPAGCRWNSMTEDYAQSWDELSGDDDLDKEIRIHNDRFLVWKASRECLVIELPIIQECCSDGGESSKWMDPEYVIEALTAAGVKYK